MLEAGYFIKKLGDIYFTLLEAESPNTRAPALVRAP
jgi:hypothetical protein